MKIEASSRGARLAAEDRPSSRIHPMRAGESETAGIGAAESSVEQGENPAEAEGGIRFCALLDSILPESVIIYLEELCFCVYNWVLSTFCRTADEPPAQPVKLHSQQRGEQPAQTPLLQAQQELLKGREGRRRRPYNGGAEQVQEERPAYVKTTITQRADNYLFTAIGVKYQFTDSEIVKGRWDDNDEISIAEDFRTQEDGSYFAENLSNGSTTRITPVRST